jgi:hypothetical protein
MWKKEIFRQLTFLWGRSNGRGQKSCFSSLFPTYELVGTRYLTIYRLRFLAYHVIHLSESCVVGIQEDPMGSHHPPGSHTFSVRLQGGTQRVKLDVSWKGSISKPESSLLARDTD